MFGLLGKHLRSIRDGYQWGYVHSMIWQGKLNLSGITEIVGQMPNNYLIACRIQKTLGQFFTALSLEWPPNFVHPLLLQ